QQVVTRLKHENTKLRERMVILEKENEDLKQQLGYLMMQMEELRAKVFGKKKGERDNNQDDHLSPPSLPRASHTYRRPIPIESEITTTKEFPMTQCKHCAAPLTDLKTIIRYQEDIVPPRQWDTVLKMVERHHITTGYCPQCKKRISAIPITKQLVTLGTNLKQFTTYANVILRLSFHQIGNFLADTVHLPLSDGELANILDEHARTLTPEVEQTAVRIRSQPGAHYDETGWKVQKQQGGYGWVMTGTDTPDAIFLLGRSRGKGNAEELKADAPHTQIGITDDYGAYRTLFKKHQLCWAHPLRKLRELQESEHLTSEERIHCRHIYEQFADLYKEVRTLSTTPFVYEERIRQKKLLVERFLTIISPHIRDPVHMGKIKASLWKQQESYFTCLTISGIPSNNNKAERALRHLVLKRKNCYGSKTQKGAETMGILFSVMLSLWWKRPKNFFAEFSRLLNPSMV
ncbi:MAG: transposase, partial [Patescibacteria group bacterium]